MPLLETVVTPSCQSQKAFQAHNDPVKNNKCYVFKMRFDIEIRITSINLLDK